MPCAEWFSGGGQTLEHNVGINSVSHPSEPFHREKLCTKCTGTAADREPQKLHSSGSTCRVSAHDQAAVCAARQNTGRAARGSAAQPSLRSTEANSCASSPCSIALVSPCFGEIFNGGEAFGNSVSPPGMLEVGRQLHTHTHTKHTQGSHE